MVGKTQMKSAIVYKKVADRPDNSPTIDIKSPVMRDFRPFNQKPHLCKI